MGAKEIMIRKAGTHGPNGIGFVSSMNVWSPSHRNLHTYSTNSPQDQPLGGRWTAFNFFHLRRGQ